MASLDQWNDENKDDKYNPAMSDSSKISSESDNSDELDNLRQLEDEGTFVNNVKGPSNLKKKSKVLLKFAPTASLAVLIGGSGLAIALVTAVLALLPIHMKEIITEKLNSQLTSQNERTTKLLERKINGTTSGVCTSKVSVLCKYSSMSDKQIDNFKKAGIKVNADEEAGKTLTGRTKPTSFEYDGKTISAKDFMSEYKKNSTFRAAALKAYNPKYAGVSDFIWTKTAKKLKISKKASDIDGKTDEERLKKIQDETKNGEDTSKPKHVSEGDDNGKGGKYTKEEADAINKASDTASELAKNADEVASSGVKSGTEALEAAENSIVDGAKESLQKLTNVFKVTGMVDDVCMAYGTVQAVGYAAKTVRSIQLARYAMIFLNVADQIKAGTAKASDVEYLGKILTTQVAETKTKKAVKSATDSYGYKYVAYGDSGKMPASASQYLAGGGLTGSLVSVTKIIDASTGGKPRQVCKILGNPIVGVGSLIVGVAGLIFAPEAIAAKDVAQAVAAVVLNAAAYALPAMLQDIIAGVLIDKNTVGEQAGDAYIAGAGKIFSDVAEKGGNSPLTPQQAADYNKLTVAVQSQYDEIDRLNASPLDYTNSSTFMGKIFAQLIPYTSNVSTLSGVVSSIASLSTGSLKLLTAQTAKAANVTADSYEVCQDMDYLDPNGDGDKSDRLATDPFCNVIYGIPTSSLNKDPLTVANNLISKGQIDESGTITGTEYKKFVTDCIDRDRPIGDTGKDGSDPDGSQCLFNANPNNEDYYLYYIDQRVDKGMDNMDDTSGGGSSSTAGASIDQANLYQSSDTIACAPGTTEAIKSQPVDVGYSGNVINIKLCYIPNTYDSDSDARTFDSLITVNSRVSGAWLAVINELRSATGDDIIKSGSSFRTHEMQLTNGNYFSNHEMGIAVDLQSIYSTVNGGKGVVPSQGSDKYFDALHYNKLGEKYGLTEYPDPYEAWHWQPTGSKY